MPDGAYCDAALTKTCTNGVCAVPVPTKSPTRRPTPAPTQRSTAQPTKRPTARPTAAGTRSPTRAPSRVPTRAPSRAPTYVATAEPMPKSSVSYCCHHPTYIYANHRKLARRLSGVEDWGGLHPAVYEEEEEDEEEEDSVSSFLRALQVDTGLPSDSVPPPQAETPSIVVNNPQIGETLYNGAIALIRWTSNVELSSIDLSLSDGTWIVRGLNAAQANGTYFWSVKATPSSSYTLTVAGSGPRGNYKNASDIFAIQDQTTLTITNPTQDEIVMLGGATSIKYAFVYMHDHLALALQDEQQKRAKSRQFS